MAQLTEDMRKEAGRVGSLGAKPGGTAKRHGTGLELRNCTKVLIRISLGTFRAMKLENTFCKDLVGDFQGTPV